MNILSGIQITVYRKEAARAMIGSFRQRHLLPMVAPAAILRRVGRVDLDKLPASFFRFARQLGEKGRPCRVSNAFCQTMSMYHAVDMQIFNGYHPEAVNHLAALLMGEVISSKGDTLMHPRYHFAMCTSGSACPLSVGSASVGPLPVLSLPCGRNAGWQSLHQSRERQMS